MRIAFVGGTGFIGPVAVRHALMAGHEVSVLHRGLHPNPNSGARSIAVDRTDPRALRRALDESGADVVVDTRAMTRADAETTLAATGAPLVVLSSQDVYAQFGRLLGHPGPAPEGRITERSPLTVPYPYRGIGEHAGGDEYDKKDVEAALRSAVERGDAAGVTVLRFPATYGPGDPARRFGAIVDAIDAGDGTLPRDGGTFRWTHAHVEDASRTIVLAAADGPAGFSVFNVGEPDAPTMSEWAERIGEHVGKPVRWIEAPVPEPLSHLGPMPNDVVVDTSAIRAAFGYAETTTVEERVAAIVSQARASRS